MDIKQELKYVIEKHKDDTLKTFQTNISAMAEDCLREIEKLESLIEDAYQQGRKDNENNQDIVCRP